MSSETGGPPASAPSFARADAPADWSPSPEFLGQSRLGAFVTRSGARDVEALQARAIADPARFWIEAIDDLGLGWQRPPATAFDAADGPAFTRWWPDGAFNHAVAALRAMRRRGDNDALTWEGEDGTVQRRSGHELEADVRRAATMLAEAGIGRGTRVAILLPMLPETVLAVLALGLLEAVFTPIFSGYAAPAIAARLRAFEVTHLITADGFMRRGNSVALKATADAAVAEAPMVRTVVVVRRLDSASADVPFDPERDRWWQLREEHRPLEDGPATDPETPYMVIYTSGTTGVPKGTVHVHGGFPVKSAQDLAHTFDLHEGDALFWLTDLGWMMGPWAISGALLLGAHLILYEGAPDFPDVGRLWAVAAAHRATHLGVSPTLIRALRLHGEDPVRSHDLRSLRVLGSTGEPWNPDPWRWYFDVVGRGRLPIVNYSGGTEVSGGILGATPLRPIRSTSFNGPCIGMAADVVDETGQTVVDAVGELAIRSPWPGMTRGFWGGRPEDVERYLDTYWRRIPGLWVHGDWAVRDRDGFWYLHGRSDDTLKVAGKRVGPAEVEAAAMSHPAVVEAAAIGVPDELKGEVIVLLCVVRADRVDQDRFEAEVAERVVRDQGKPTKPARVAIVPELPRTRSGKIMRRVARAAWLGIDPGDLSALENPGAVAAIAATAGAAARP